MKDLCKQKYSMTTLFLPKRCFISNINFTVSILSKFFKNGKLSLKKNSLYSKTLEYSLTMNSVIIF